MIMVVPVEEVYVEALQDMLKIFDMDDLVMLWNLVKERFSSIEPTDDKERALWVELKRETCIFGGKLYGIGRIGGQSGNTLRVSQFRFYNEKLVSTLLEG
ncbi:hypothetical protein Tco_0056052, partial [Tanacetum coccineum]